MKPREAHTPSPAEAAEAVRVRQLREDARRPISVNLTEGIALSHKLMRFTGAARSAAPRSRFATSDAQPGRTQQSAVRGER